MFNFDVLLHESFPRSIIHCDLVLSEAYHLVLGDMLLVLFIQLFSISFEIRCKSVPGDDSF